MKKKIIVNEQIVTKKRFFQLFKLTVYKKNEKKNLKKSKYAQPLKYVILRSSHMPEEKAEKSNGGQQL